MEEQPSLSVLDVVVMSGLDRNFERMNDLRGTSPLSKVISEETVYGGMYSNYKDD
jgi:hypothetical protein